MYLQQVKIEVNWQFNTGLKINKKIIKKKDLNNDEKAVRDLKAKNV